MRGSERSVGEERCERSEGWEGMREKCWCEGLTEKGKGAEKSLEQQEET